VDGPKQIKESNPPIMVSPTTRVTLTAALHCEPEELEQVLATAYEKLLSGYDFDDTAAGQRDQKRAARLIVDLMLEVVDYADATIDFENEVMGLGQTVCADALFDWCVDDMRFIYLDPTLIIGSEEWHVGIAALLANCKLSYEKDRFFNLQGIEDLCRRACSTSSSDYAAVVLRVLTACGVVLGDQLAMFTDATPPS
jgi:hypothetical protein